eukprot:4714500-Lingulodinium_polyedra.AAC.1
MLRRGRGVPRAQPRPGRPAPPVPRVPAVGSGLEDGASVLGPSRIARPARGLLFGLLRRPAWRARARAR